MIESIKNLFREKPTLENIRSQCCTASQFNEQIYNFWLNEIVQQHKYHRKQWEYVFILQALSKFNKLNNGVKGLGFGCGKEPLAAVMAKYGCDVLATDIKPFEQSDAHWGANSFADIFYPGICSEEIFAEKVSFMHVDMNDIPMNVFAGYDFVWSCCAFEHLGSLDAGINFVLNSSECLKSGGIAVHTTELNINNGNNTLESPGLSLYRKKDLERLVTQLEDKGFTVLPFNWYSGNLPQDKHVDLPPYKQEIHLKLKIEQYVLTSFGLVIVNK